jgi:hypothetical protein
MRLQTNDIRLDDFIVEYFDGIGAEPSGWSDARMKH